MKRIITLALVALMLFGLAAGCAGNGTPSATSTPTPTAKTTTDGSGNGGNVPDDAALGYPIVTDGSVTFSLWWVLDQQAAPFVQDYADGKNYAWKAIMENTGINIKFLHPSSTSSAEQFQVMIAGGDYPDIINGATSSYTGGADKAVEDDVFIRLNELAEQYAPNYMKLVGLSETNRKNNYTDEGNMVVFSQVYDRVQPPFAGYAVRQDWLDDLGIARPETIGEWYDMLVAFRDGKTHKNAPPLEMYKTGIPITGYFSGAYGVAGAGFGTGSFIQVDGEIQLSTMNDSFRDYLTEMHRWYDEGLMDTDFIVNGSSPIFPNFPRMGSNESGAVPLMYTSAGSYFADSGLAEAGSFFSLVKYPKLNKNDELLAAFKGYGEGTLGGGMGGIITTACKYPEYAVRFLDYLYSEEGSMITNYGVEGVTYSIVDGKPRHTDLIASNPDGMTTTTAQHVYLINNGIVIFMLDREEDTQSEAALEYREIWADRGKYNIVGNLSYTAAEGAERSGIMNDANTLIEEFTVKVIMGETQLNDDTWNTYITQLKNMGIERAVAITQAAYDRYQSR